MLSGGFLCPAAQQAGPGQHGCDGEEQRHHIRLLPDALKHAVDQHADEAAQHARAKRRPAGLCRAHTAAQAVADEAKQHHAEGRHADDAVLREDLDVIVINIHILDPRQDGILHRDGAAVHAIAHAENGIRGLEVADGRGPALCAAAAGIRVRKLRREQVADAAAHERQRAGHRAAHEHQGQQAAVDEQGEQHGRNGQREPRAARHREQAARTHGKTAQPEQHLLGRALAGIGQTDGHRREQDHIGAHNVRIAEDGVDTRAHRAFGGVRPACRNGHADDELPDAMQGQHRGNDDHGEVHLTEIALVADEMRDKIEHRQIFHARSEAREIHGRRRTDRHQQEHAHREIERDPQADAVGRAGKRAPCVDAAVDDPHEREEHQQLIPDGGNGRQLQHIAQQVVHDRIGREQEQQEARHAARKQPAEQEAVPQRCHDAAVNAVGKAVLQHRHDARPDAAQPRIAAVHQPAVGRALHGGLPAEQAAQRPAGQGLRKRAVDRRKHPRQERAVVQGRKRREQPPEQTGPQQLIHEASPWR